MAGSNRAPAPLNGPVPPQWGTPEGNAQAQAQPQGHQLPGHQLYGQSVQGQPAQSLAPGHYGQPQPHPNDALSRWMPPQQAYGQQPGFQQPQPAYAPAQQAYAPAQQAYATPQGYGQPATGQYAPQPAPAGNYPQTDPFAQLSAQPQTGYPSEATQRQAYAAPYDRFGPPPGQQQYDPQPSGQQPSGQQPSGQYAPGQHGGYAGDPRQVYDQHLGHGQGYVQAQQPHPQQHAAPQAEMQNWDLANYAPGQPLAAQGAPNHGGHQTQLSYPAFEPGHQARAEAYDPRYAQPAFQGQPGQGQSGQGQSGQGQSGQGQPGVPQGAAYDHDRYAQSTPQQGYAPQAGYEQQPHDGHEPLDQEAADQDFAYDEEPAQEKRRGPRLMVVAGALVGAILIGGGLAKGYQMLGSGGKDGDTPPLVRADKSDIKTKPVNAGGKAIENTDKKFLNRLETANGGSSVAGAPDVVVPPAAVSDPDAPRKVPTMVVSRDGTITPQIPAAAPAPSGVPGMVVDGLAPAPAPLRNTPVTAEPAPTPVVRQAPVAPKVVDLPLPKVKADGVTPPAPKKKVAVRDDLKAGSATTTAAASGGGYVVALVSTKTKDEALKTFANLHQTYADLQDKVPDVREIDRGEKGVFHRLIAGPPSSKEAATELCKKLKAQGFKDCWVTPY